MKKTMKFIFVLLIGSLLLNVYGLFQIKEMKMNLVEQVSFHSHEMEHRLSSIEYQLSESLERDKWIQQIHFTLSDQKAELGVIYLDVEWALKEVEKEAEILFQYRKEDGKWTKVEADVISGSMYQTTIPLSIKDQYIYQISANGSMIKGSEMEYIPTEIYQPEPLSIEYGTTHTVGSKDVSYELYVTKYHRESDQFEVANLFALIKTENGEIEKKELQTREHEEIEYNEFKEFGETNWFVQFEADEQTTVQLEVQYTNGYQEVLDTDPFYRH